MWKFNKVEQKLIKEDHWKILFDPDLNITEFSINSFSAFYIHSKKILVHPYLSSNCQGEVSYHGTKKTKYCYKEAVDALVTLEIDFSEYKNQLT